MAVPAAEELPEEEPPFGTLQGTVRLTGEAPPRTFIDLRAAPHCAAKHPDGLLEEDLVADANKNLQGSVVYLQWDPAPWQPRRFSRPPVVLTISGCRYTPRIVGVVRDNQLKIVNADEITHTVSDGRRARMSVIGGGKQVGMSFSTRHSLERFSCDFHPWETGWVAVMAHPYFAITDAQGKYSIPRVPAGKYLLHAWQERCVRTDQTVVVREGETTRAEFEMKLDRR